MPTAKMRELLLINKVADEVFRRLAINPQFASIAAFEVESFPLVQLMPKLQQRREFLAITRPVFAQKVGYSAGSVRLWEDGSHWPRLDQVIDIAQALDLDLSATLTPRTVAAVAVRAALAEKPSS